jgi:sugar phosphate isomerase/epimerase
MIRQAFKPISDPQRNPAMADFLYCLNSSTIKPTPILEKIKIAGQTGYAALELWHDDIDLHLAAGGTLRDLRKAIGDQGLTIPTTIYLKGWFETVGTEHLRELDECRRRMTQASELAALHVIAGPPAGQADHDQGARNYHELLEMGRQIGVKPAMEYLGFVEDLNTIEAASEIVVKSAHPDASIVHDPFHIFRGGGSFDSLTKLPADRIAICHFNDAPTHPPRLQQHDKDRVMPGDGCLDLGGMLRRLKEIGYNRWLSLELFREDLWSRDPRDVAREGLAKMRAVAETC